MASSLQLVKENWEEVVKHFFDWQKRSSHDSITLDDNEWANCLADSCSSGSYYIGIVLAHSLQRNKKHYLPWLLLG